MPIDERVCVHLLALVGSALVGCTRDSDADRAPPIAPLDAEVRPAPTESPVVEQPVVQDPTFAIEGTIDGTPLAEAAAYVFVSTVAGRTEVVGLDLLGDPLAGCDDRSKWVTNRGAVLLTRDHGVWSARFHAPDPEELPCPGGADHSFPLGTGHVRMSLDVPEHTLVPGTIVDGQVEIETGKRTHPAAHLAAHFHARVCARP